MPLVSPGKCLGYLAKKALPATSMKGRSQLCRHECLSAGRLCCYQTNIVEAIMVRSSFFIWSPYGCGTCATARDWILQ